MLQLSEVHSGELAAWDGQEVTLLPFPDRSRHPLHDTIQAWKAKQQALLGWDAEGASFSSFFYSSS